LYYRRFSEYLRERYGKRVYRISIDAGFSCPNRDGTLSRKGCYYCSPGGSWVARGNVTDIKDQIEKGREIAKRRYRAEGYIVYFQAYTNTYGSVDRLKQVYDHALDCEGAVAIAVGTRPDCIDREKIELLASYKEKGLDVWVEYGLQSANDRTLELINRRHTYRDFEIAVVESKKAGLLVSAHVIIGLPGEGEKEILYTAEKIANLPLDGLKLHNLTVLKGSVFEKWYMEGRLELLTLDEYVGYGVKFLERINPQVVIQRLVSDAPREVLIAPEWSLEKQKVLDKINGMFRRLNTYQGRLFGEVIEKSERK